MECISTVRAIALITSRINQLKMHQWLEDPLTAGTCTIAAIVIFETGGDGESVSRGENSFNSHINRGVQKTHGEIRLISVLEPQPEQVGFVRVVSTIVQLSPLKPQFPTWEEHQETINTQDVARNGISPVWR